MKIHDYSLIKEDKKRNNRIYSFDEDIDACFSDIKSRFEEFDNISDTPLYLDSKNSIRIFKRRWAVKNPRLSTSNGYRVIYAVIDNEIILPIYVYLKKEEIRESTHERIYKMRMGIS